MILPTSIPVVAKRKKNTALPYLRFPPKSYSSDSESSGSDQPLVIPEKGFVTFATRNGKPGFQITRSTSNWTPIASRTRAMQFLAGCYVL